MKRKLIWKPIPGLEDRYEISNYGTIRDKETKEIVRRKILSKNVVFYYTEEKNGKEIEKSLNVLEIMKKVFSKVYKSYDHENRDRYDFYLPNLNEDWVKIPGREAFEISTFGRIRSAKTKKLLPRMLKSGYIGYMYGEYNKEKDKEVLKSFKVHKIMGDVFLKIVDPDKTVVNHINGDKYDCHIDNLEYTDGTGNVQHAIDNGLITITRSPVIQFDLETGKEIKRYDSITEASKEMGISTGQISGVCTHYKGSVSAHGFGWKFVEENPNKQKDIDFIGYKQIVGFPNYVINKEGRIYSFTRQQFMNYQRREGSGLEVQLSSEDNKKNLLIHRLVASHFLKRKDPTHNSIRHKDGDKTNNQLSNLEWCYVPGTPAPPEYYKTPYYDPKTAIKAPKRKAPTKKPVAKKSVKSSGSKTAKEKTVSNKAKKSVKKSGSKTSKKSNTSVKKKSTKQSIDGKEIIEV